jgi:hypothetical protein
MAAVPKALSEGMWVTGMCLRKVRQFVGKWMDTNTSFAYLNRLWLRTGTAVSVRCHVTVCGSRTSRSPASCRSRSARWARGTAGSWWDCPTADKRRQCDNKTHAEHVRTRGVRGTSIWCAHTFQMISLQFATSLVFMFIIILQMSLTLHMACHTARIPKWFSLR